jgi:hypothetical protein
LIVAAAFGREIVNRRFRGLPDDDDTVTADARYWSAGAPLGSSPERQAGSVPERHGGRFDDDGYDGAWDDDTTDEEVRRLRRSVAMRW